MRGLREHCICRLCLSTGCRLIDILEESRNDEFVVKQAIEDLLRFVVVREALYPWLVCSICLEKLRDFYFFKRRCVESQEVYDSRIRGNILPVNQVWSSESDDIPLKSEEENAVDGALSHGAYRNMVSDHSNQPITEGLTLDSLNAVKSEEVVSTWESLVMDSRNPTNGSLFEVSQSAIGHDSDIDIPIKSEGDNAFEDPLQHDTCKNGDSDHSSQSIDIEGLGIDHKAGVVTIHGMEVESSRNEQYGAGNCVSEKGQEAVSEQDAMSRYKTSPLLAEESNTVSNAASAPGGKDASRRRTQTALRGSGADMSRGRGGVSWFFGLRKVRERFICVECGATFLCKLTLSSHIRVHQSRIDDTLAAKEGQGLENEHGTKFPRSNYEEGLGTCRDLGGEGFICVQYGKACARKTELINHIRSHIEHPRSHMRTQYRKRTFECEVCNKTFSQGGNLRVHMRTHDGKRPFECEVCNKTFSQSGNLRVHMRTHDGKEPFNCELCNKRFSLSGNLRRHMRTHDGKRPFECEVCNKTFSLSWNMRVHRRTHEGKRPFECEVCHKKFTLKGNLKSHMRTHDGKRPFGCEVCNKTFSQGGNLRAHLRTHDGKRPFECEVCKKKFSFSGNLSRHMRTHDGNRPFECQLCHKKFSQSGSLRRHMRTHDGTRPF